MNNILVTGAAGFIGTNFVYYWNKKNPEDRIVALDALTYAGNIRNLDALKQSPRFRFVQGDIRNQDLIETLLIEEKINILVHFAAESHVDRSISGPDVFIDTNIVGTHSLLKAARKIWLDKNKMANHRFHHISTDEVFGSLGPKDSAFSETTPYSPNSPYSASKASSDHLVRAYHHTYGLQTTTSNCSNNYGPFHFPEKLFPLCILNILNGKNLPIYGNGQQIRDWLHVEDHCRGIELILKKGQVGETYNVGGNNEQANLNVVELICKIMDELFAANSGLAKTYPKAPPAQGKSSHSLITFVTDRPGHDVRYAVDTAKIQKELGYKPQVQFTDGLRSTIQWYLDHQPWWQELQSRTQK